MELSPVVPSCSASSSSASLSRESPPIPHSPFSDQSHLSFYASRRASFSSPRLKIVRSPLMPPRLAPRAGQSLQSFDASIAAEQDLLQELADLKLQMKLKKKALKAQMKEKKKAIKAEGKKKQKKEREMTTMMGESSSSSSESSDSECEGETVADATELTMKGAGQMAGAMAAEGGVMLEREERDGERTLSEQKKEREVTTMMGESSSSSSESSDSECEGETVADARELKMKGAGQMAAAMAAEGGVMLEQEERDGGRALSEPVTGKGVGKLTTAAGMMQSVPVIGKGAAKSAMEAGTMSSGVLSEDRNVDDFQTFIEPLVVATTTVWAKHVAHKPVTAGRIEVCTGGKCRKAGSQQLLASLKSQQGANQVEAVACKCMGRCAMGINVKVQKQLDSNPLVFSHVSASDAALILNQGFGLGRPPTGLPSLGGCTVPALAPTALTSTA